MQIVLASESERRKTLLSWLKVPFAVSPSGFDEERVVLDDPDELVAELATQKAELVARRLREERVFAADEEERTMVLGADTVIEVDGEIIGKPKDEADARRILTLLAGRSHEVWTGVCVVDLDTFERRVETDHTTVTFRHVSDKELQDYLDSKEWEGKAGAYMIMGAIQSWVKDVEGSITGVMGLPLLVVEELLEDFGVMVGVEDVRAAISEKTGYTS